MIKYKSPPHKILLFLCLLYLICLTSTAQPVQKCSFPQYYHILPLVPNQKAILNLDNIFEGYNLNFTLQGQAQWSKYINLSQKVRIQKSQIPINTFIGLKSYNMQKIGNSWGNSFVALLERDDKTYLSYGFLGSNTTIPVINNQVQVQQDVNIKCYDAVIFPKEDILIVDCAKKLSSPDLYGFTYTNYFYYAQISKPVILKNETKTNQMFIPFQSITRRKLQLYKQRISGNTYMLRSYLYDGVDQKNQNNTYIDVFMVTKPLTPWVVAVIDRSYLKKSTLRVADFKVYLSEIYVLDYTKGLHRVRINTEQDLVYNGFYEAKGFTRFDVYSNNLDDRYEIALANNHQVIQIDWSRIDDPILLNKYSLMPNSDIRQISLNQRFVVVVSTTKFNSSLTYAYTWVLTRGGRTYTKAFMVFKHENNQMTFVDLNAEQSFLLVIDETRLTNLAIDQAILTMALKHDEDFIDRKMSFKIVGKSIQPTTGNIATCTLILNFTLVEQNNKTMWAVGDAPSPYYNANYPGKVVIPIHQYAIGPNITYRITQVKKGQLKKYKIYQQDQLKINWQNQLPLNDIRFLRTQTITRKQTDILLIYTQNQQNITHITQCLPNHHQIDVFCNQSAQLPTEGQINNWATTIFRSRYTSRTHHVVAFTTKQHYNKVIFEDFSGIVQKKELVQGKGFAGNVTNVQAYGRYLFVIKRYYKIIHVYDLQLLTEGLDQPICSINHKLMYDLGVKYFSPQSVQTTQFYPNILFIKTSDTIIVLDMNRQCVPKLLSVLRPVQSTLVQFSFAITRNHLIVTAVPNHIVQYDLSRIYLKDIKQTKRYPMYGYKLPRNYDTDVSQYGNCMYITTVSQGGDYQIFIYRAGNPAISVLYDIIDLYTYQSILVDASGGSIDYVTVYSGSQLRIFRQYQTPVAQIGNPQGSYSFYIQYFNIITSIYLQLISVSIINLPTKIAVNPYLDDIMNTKDLLFSDENKISQINDTDWYDGNVLTIKSDCRDCQDLVVVKNHIHYQNKYEIIPGLIDYGWNNQGGAFLGYDAILGVGHDGQIKDFIHLPQSRYTVCYSTSVPYHANYQASACIQGGGINLYLTSLMSHKGFTFVPYSSRAQYVLKIQAVNELVMVVDTSFNPFFKSRPGGVIIYALNFDTDLDEAFQQLQYIDYTDFTDSDKPSYIVNADLTYHPQTDTYRLYITQITKGIYCIVFRYLNQVAGINILQNFNLDIPSRLNNLSYYPPYDATYQGIKVIQSYYNPSLSQSKDVFILTTGVYHTMMFQIKLNEAFKPVDKVELKKIFLRYAYYVVQNQIKYINGLIILKQILPEEYQTVDQLKSKQIISVYDVRAIPINMPPNKIPQLGLIGAHMIMDRQPRTYDFNLTYNTSDPHDEPRVNMVIVHQLSNTIDQLSLHRNLSVFTKQKVDTQIIYLDLINDFDYKKIRILLNGYSPYPEWKLITIILFSIIGFFILMGVCFISLRKLKAYIAIRNGQSQQRSSLITQQITQRNSTSYENPNNQKYERSSSNQNKNEKSYGKQKDYDTSYGKKDNSYSSYNNKYDKKQNTYSYDKKQNTYGYDKRQSTSGYSKKQISYGYDKKQSTYNRYDINNSQYSNDSNNRYDKKQSTYGYDRYDKRQSTNYDKYDKKDNQYNTYDRNNKKSNISDRYEQKSSIFDRYDKNQDKGEQSRYDKPDNKNSPKNDKVDRYSGTFYS